MKRFSQRRKTNLFQCGDNFGVPLEDLAGYRHGLKFLQGLQTPLYVLVTKQQKSLSPNRKPEGVKQISVSYRVVHFECKLDICVELLHLLFR